MTRSEGSRADPARAVARAILYEGYVLWPYRRSAPKNQRRWTFGGVHPRDWSEDGHGDDPCTLHSEFLVRVPSPAAEAPSLSVRLRFLQVVRRRVARVEDGGALDFVDTVEVEGVRWSEWDEAREREVALPSLPLRSGAERSLPIRFREGEEREWLEDSSGRSAAAVVRSWRSLSGEVGARCQAVEENVLKVTVTVTNDTPWSGSERQDALRSTFASTHLAIESRDAELLSLTDPPEGLRAAADACRNMGWWPILVGERGTRDTLLVSPIILPDHPAIAPESPGDFFDGGEIDEMLALHILALTDAEKEEMRATDPRTREILERTASMDEEALRNLHGTFRDPGTGAPRQAPAGNLAEDAPDPFWVEMGQAPDQRLVVDGVELSRGSRVLLHPDPGGDVMDLALAGRVGIVEGIDEDDAGGVHLTVVVEDDPGLDMGMAKMPGHRFFFRPEEVEPLDPGPRVLVAGIGNVLLGDDGFGVEVVRRLGERECRKGVTVRDFGIRGLDLAYALKDYDVAVFVDAVPLEDEPGTLRLIDATDAEGVPDGAVGVRTHGMDPARVLAFARSLGPVPERVYVLGCEPARIPDPTRDEIVGELSDPVAAAVAPAVDEVRRILDEIRERPPDDRPVEQVPADDDTERESMEERFP